MFRDVPEQRQPGLRVQALVAKDLADEPHQLALQDAPLGRALGRPLAGSSRVGNCCGDAGSVPGS
jgi:hypothetical protein